VSPPVAVFVSRPCGAELVDDEPTRSDVASRPVAEVGVNVEHRVVAVSVPGVAVPTVALNA